MNIKAIADATISPARGTEDIKYMNGSTGDIMKETFACFKEEKADVLKLAPYLKAPTLYHTCKNIYDLIRDNIAYQEDPLGKQWVRAPRRLWKNKVGDCKSYSVFAASCLAHLGIGFYFRFACYDKTGIPTHVYIVVPDKKNEIIIDPAALNLPFNIEAIYKKKIDYAMTQISRLGAIPKQTNLKKPVIKGFETLGCVCATEPKVNGLINDLLFAKGLKAQLWNAIPALAPWMIYLFFPDSPEFRKVQPEKIRYKQWLLFADLFDMGAQGNFNSMNELYPYVRQLVTAYYGMEPEKWLQSKLPKYNITRGYPFGGDTYQGVGLSGYRHRIGDVFSDITATFGVPSNETGLPGGTDVNANISFVSSILSKIGPSIQWKRGGINAWGPKDADWEGNPYGYNLAKDINAFVNAKNGFVATPTLTVTNTTQVITPTTDTPPAKEASINPWLIGGLAATALGLAFGGKKGKK